MVFKRAGTPCARCQTVMQARGQGDDNRTTYWCPHCQARDGEATLRR
jgi:endonuclease-8